MTQTTLRYEIRLDVLAALEYLERDDDANDAPDYDALAPSALIDLAALANATFTNVVVAPIHDAYFSSADVALHFDATPDDAARYVAAYDLDPDIDIDIV